MKPKVSVLCITFNQAGYIQQTLDGFLKQKTNFGYEILIHDDASTDGTTAILERYAQQYPDKIRLFTEKENQYSKHNFEFIKDLFVGARGRYIAMCEGDDYWTDVDKLQQQADFLDKNSDYAVCFHASEVIYEKSNKSPYIYPDVQDKSWYTLEELFRINYIPTASVMYRKQNYETFVSDMMPGDWYMHLFHAQFGKIKYMSDTMSIYRKHEDGVFYEFDGQRDKIWIKHAVDYANFYRELLSIYKKNPKYVAIIKDQLYQHMERILGIDQKYTTNLFDKIADIFPRERRSFMDYQHVKIGELNEEKDFFRAELLKAGDERYAYEVEADKFKQDYLQLKGAYDIANKELSYIKKTRWWKGRQVARRVATSIKRKRSK